MKLFRVQQRLRSNPIDSCVDAVNAQLDSLDLHVPQGDIAITAGSRGIANIPTITKAAGDWLRAKGATPFIVPAMGSHNGATAAGQRNMIESLGITEEAMGMEIRASMECVKVGSVRTGDVWMDRYCAEAAGVLVLNRVKLHTCFAGDLQSGLVKMMVVGMGKIRSAETFHSAPTPQMNEMLEEMGAFLLGSSKIWAGLAILEDGFDQTAEFHAIPPGQILERERELLIRHREYFPRLPVDDINVLVVDEIGKVFSGTGMDTNVIGYRGIRGFEDLDRPRIQIICALGLAEKSQGNAIGVGLADFCTRRLRDAIDEQKSMINTMTTGDMQRFRIPATLPDDETLITQVSQRYGERGWMFIPNTLHLERLYVSEDIATELKGRTDCAVDVQPTELQFTRGRLQLDYNR